MADYLERARVYWDEWDKLVADAVFGTIEKVFDTDIRSKPCPHTYDLFAVKTPTILVTWALLYLFIVGVGLLTITPADKSKKVSRQEDQSKGRLPGVDSISTPDSFVVEKKITHHSTAVFSILTNAFAPFQKYRNRPRRT